MGGNFLDRGQDTAQTLSDCEEGGRSTTAARAGIPTEVAERLKALEQENRELRLTNETLPKASAYFAQAKLDRSSTFKP